MPAHPECDGNEQALQRTQNAYFFPFGFPFAYSHHAKSVQLSQAGFRAAQTRRPWKMSK